MTIKVTVVFSSSLKTATSIPNNESSTPVTNATTDDSLQPTQRTSDLSTSNEAASTPTKKKRKANKRERFSYKCCFHGCDNTNLTRNVKFQTVQPPINTAKDLTMEAPIRKVRSYYRKKLLRTYTLSRCGIKEDGKRKRLCEDHGKEEIVVKKKYNGNIRWKHSRTGWLYRLEKE